MAHDNLLMRDPVMYQILHVEHHRPLYDWFLDRLGIHHPRQIEYPRIDVGFTVLGKRHLIRLVEGGLVNGWDDPRLPTLRGMSRRGYPPATIRAFCAGIPLADGKVRSTVDILDAVNPDSMHVLTGCRVEPFLASLAPGARVQFERQGYFCMDPESTPERPVFHRTATLKDAWKRLQARNTGAASSGQ